jgi:hypothetical protein
MEVMNNPVKAKSIASDAHQNAIEYLGLNTIDYVERAEVKAI